jgi:hypothetical protein
MILRAGCSAENAARPADVARRPCYNWPGNNPVNEMSDNQPTFAWPRFWIPAGGSIDLSDSGFLSEPNHDHGPETPRPLAALAGWRSLALLGEPGIG